MIINFDNIGGGGGGSYVLPVATASRLGGVKIGSGLTITNDGVLSSEGGGSDPNAQHWFTASTKSAAESLTGLTEGDVVIIPGHNENVPAPVDFYDAVCYWGWNFIETLNFFLGFSINDGGDASIVFTKTANPYYDGESSPYDCYVSFYYWDDSISKYIVYLVGYITDANGFVVADGVEVEGNPADPETIVPVESWTADTFTMAFTSEHSYQSSMVNQTQLFVIYGNTTNATATTVSAIKYIDSETVQLNNGSLINLANDSDVQSALTKAEQALSEASQKFPNFDSYGIPSWNDFADYSTGVYTNLHINGVDEGTRLHKSGESNTEFTNPKIEEIMTNRNPGVVPATLRVVSLNQNEYDALVSGGETSDNTLYIIVDDTKWQS